MPELEETGLETYLTDVLDALVNNDRTKLKLFGQQDGFVDNRIREFVWFFLSIHDLF
jgi:hypothetical protein